MKKDGSTLEMCRKCYTFRHDSGWRMGRPKFLRKSEEGDKVFVRLIQCPACREKTLTAYNLPYPHMNAMLLA